MNNSKNQAFTHRKNSDYTSLSESASYQNIPEYIPAQNNTNKELLRKNKTSKRKLFFAGAGILVALSVVSSLFHDVLTTTSLEDRVRELNLEGMPSDVAVKNLDAVLRDGEGTTIDYPEDEDIDDEVRYIVDDVDVVGETVELSLDYHPYTVISQMGIIGTSLPEAIEELDHAGYQRDVDYIVYAENSRIFAEENWSVVDVGISEGEGFTEIIVTNSTLEQLEDNAQGLVENLQGEVQNYNNTLEEESLARAENRGSILDLDIEGQQWSEAERVLYQNNWHSSDYITRTDTGMPVLNSRNWTVVEIDTTLSDRPVVFLEK